MTKKITIAALISLIIVGSSCKHDTVIPNHRETKNITQNQREDITYPNEFTYVNIDNGFVGAVINNSDYSAAAAEFNMDPANSILIEYEDVSKKIVMIPIIESSNKIQKYFITKFVGENIEGSQFVKFSGTDDYLNLLGDNPLFYNPSELPFSGVMETFDLQQQPLTTTTFQDNTKLVWTHHGGYSTWTDCFEHYSGTYWGIIGYVVCPVGMLVGISAGCL